MDAQLLTPEEISNYRSEIRRGSGSPLAPDFKEKFHASIESVWNGSPLKELITVKEFRSLVLRPPMRNKRNGKNHRKHKDHQLHNTAFDNEQRKIVFAQLVKNIANKCGRVPDDCIMDCIGDSLGYSHAVWDATKRDMQMHGYNFTRIENGYKVTLPSPEMQRLLAVEQEIRKLREERETLHKKIHNTALAA